MKKENRKIIYTIKDLFDIINHFDNINSVSGVEYEIKDNGDIIYTIPCDTKPIRILIESKNYNGLDKIQNTDYNIITTKQKEI